MLARRALLIVAAAVQAASGEAPARPNIAPATAGFLQALDQQALPELLRALGPQPTGTPLRHLRIIGAVSGRSATAHLLTAYEQATSDGIRCQLLKTMGETRDPRLLQFLVRKLQDPSVPVQAYAVWALGELGQRAALPALRERLWSLDPNVQMAAIDAVGKIGRDPDTAAEAALFLGDPSVQVRYLAAKAMGGLALPRMLPQLFDRLERESSLDVQAALVRSIVESGRGAAVERFIQLLKSPSNPAMEHWAIAGLAAAEPALVLPAIQTLISEKNSRSTLAAARLIAALELEPLRRESGVWMPVIARWHEDSDPAVQAAARRLLERIQAPVDEKGDAS
jgi:HEAT repeat protein